MQGETERLKEAYPRKGTGAPAMCKFTLLRVQANIVAALIDHHLADERYDRNWTIEATIERALKLRDAPNDDQYREGCDILADASARLCERGRGRYRLSRDEARMVSALCTTALHSRYQWDFGIEDAVIEALDLNDQPTENQYGTGTWAIEQASVRIKLPERQPVRAGDVLHVYDELGVVSAGEYTIVAVSDSGLDLLDDMNIGYHVSQAELEDEDVEIERRFIANREPRPPVPEPEPRLTETPRTKDDRKLGHLLRSVQAAEHAIAVLERDLRCCAEGTFPSSNPERTAAKLRAQLPPWQEMIAAALPQIEELKARPTDHTAALLAAYTKPVTVLARGYGGLLRNINKPPFGTGDRQGAI